MAPYGSTACPLMDAECFFLHFIGAHAGVVFHADECIKRHKKLRSHALAAFRFLKSMQPNRKADDVRRQLIACEFAPFDLAVATRADLLKRQSPHPLADEHAIAAAHALTMNCPVATVQPDAYRAIAGLAVEDWRRP